MVEYKLLFTGFIWCILDVQSVVESGSLNQPGIDSTSDKEVCIQQRASILGWFSILCISIQWDFYVGVKVGYAKKIRGIFWVTSLRWKSPVRPVNEVNKKIKFLQAANKTFLFSFG